jgi:transcriptional regulator with XRE-family HTH domain
MSRTHRKVALNPEELARVAALRKQLKNKPSPDELIAIGGYDSPITMGDTRDIAELLASMKAIRINSAMSLRDCADSAGIDYAALSRLENGIAANPTVHTLARFARALGKCIQYRLVDEADFPKMRRRQLRPSSSQSEKTTTIPYDANSQALQLTGPINMSTVGAM